MELSKGALYGGVDYALAGCILIQKHAHVRPAYVIEPAMADATLKANGGTYRQDFIQLTRGDANLVK